MATINRIGFGQVEPNHLSAQRTAQIYAQLPAAEDIEVLENGQYVKYDYANSEVNFTGKGEWMMVFNEVKLYDDRWRETYKDFAMIKENYTKGSDYTHEGYGPFKGQMVPRVIKTNIGDIYTTNCLEAGNTDGKAEITGTEDLSVGDELSPNAKGYLSKTGDGSIKFQVVKIYTLADGQAAVKVMRIA
ncbi:MAG: hypothetical protein ACI4PE_03230 [Bacilli bacterium]